MLQHSGLSSISQLCNVNRGSVAELDSAQVCQALAEQASRSQAHMPDDVLHEAVILPAPWALPVPTWDGDEHDTSAEGGVIGYSEGPSQLSNARWVAETDGQGIAALPRRAWPAPSR